MANTSTQGTNKKTVKKRYIFIFLGLILTLFISLKVLHLYDSLRDELIEIKYGNMATKNILEHSIPWSDRRQREILFMGDQIVKEWSRIGFKGKRSKAFLVAEKNMLEAEKYPDVDPLLLLAMQWKESSFRDSVISPVGAIGLCQIMPPTGRMLMGYFQIEYDRESLFNIETNIKLAAKYVDILYREYRDYGQVLAWYNGGGWQRKYYAENNPKLAEETADYIPKVISKWEEYKEALLTYNVNKRDQEALADSLAN